MSWLNITRNVEDYNEECIGWLAANNNLWAITASGSAAPSGSTVPDAASVRLRKKLPADGSSQGWNASYTGLPVATSYNITGFAADTEYDRLYIANNATGEVFYNITGDPQDDWDKILSKAYGTFQGVEGNIRDLKYYNKKVFLAHKGGVSAMDPLTRTWTLVGDFATGFDGIGQCNNFYVLNNELYVSVSFGDLGAVFKYNTDTLSLKWDKFAELSATATEPEYIAARDNILFCTNADEGQNIFNGEGIDVTLTGQPRFTRSKHLKGVPSSMLTHSVDNFIYVTCWNANYSSTSDAHTDNLVTSVRQLVPYSAEPGETFINTATGAAENDYTTHTILDGGDRFSNNTPENPLLAIKFSIQTNALEFLPGEIYTIRWEYGYQCSARALSRQLGILTAQGSGPLKVGFKSNAGTGIDANSPRATFVNNTQTLFNLDPNKQTLRHTFTFNADDLATTTDGEFRIEGTVAAAVKAALRRESWRMNANALIRNFKVFRGDEEIANSEFINVEYVAKEYSNIPVVERGNHSIGEPSPPDQWFAKFPAVRDLSVVNIPGSEDNAPPPVGMDPGGGGGFDWPPPPPPPPPPPGDDDEIDPPPPPPPPGDTDNDSDGSENTYIIDENATAGFATKLSRLLCTNRMNLVPDETYRFHVIINRVKNSDSDKPLHIRISPSKAAVRPAYDGTVTTTGVQFPIVWEFSTAGFTNADLTGIRFRIDLFETEIDISDGATAYVSDWNMLGKIRELPSNTIYRYDGEIWDNALTELSSDNGITDAAGYPNSLVESYEVNSDANRLYCISAGNIYVWGIGANDPYGGSSASRIVMAW